MKTSSYRDVGPAAQPFQRGSFQSEGLKKNFNGLRMRKLFESAALISFSLTCFSVSAQAQTADPQKMQAQIDALVAQVRALKAEMHEQTKEHRETQVKIKEVVKQAQAAASSVPLANAPYPPPLFADRKLHLGILTLSPGGFVEGAGVWRQHSEQADLASSFGPLGGEPLRNSPLYNLQESRFSARNSRASLLAEAPVAPGVLVSGYGDFDFFGAAETSNGLDSNSYVPRIRSLYASVDLADPGVHVLAGQTWTLLQLQGKGLDPRAVVAAPVIDPGYYPGQLWERGAQIRFVKDLGPFTAGLSFENPQNYYAQCPGASTVGTATTGAFGVSSTTGFGSLGAGLPNVFCQSTGGTYQGQLQNYSFNHIPDIVGKLAWDGNLGGDHPVHLEAMGYFTDLYNQVSYGGAANATTGIVSGYTAPHTVDTTGWGAGGGFVATLIPKWLDTEAQVFVGRGIGRFGTALLPADTFKADGTISPIPEVMFHESFTAHVTPKLDLWVAAGFEREFSDYLSTTIGVGAPAANNSGCYIIGGTCGAATKVAWQATGGAWYKLYAGDFGTVRWGVQYSFSQRILFPGSGTTAGGPPALAGSPTTADNIVLTALRWYPFDPAPPAPALAAKY